MGGGSFAIWCQWLHVDPDVLAVALVAKATGEGTEHGRQDVEEA
jgi:hypothetical protein